MNDKKYFPGGSKSRVNAAGDRIRKGVATKEDLVVIDEWRAAHRAVLNTFQAILRTRTRTTNITVAQRHKRRSTIFGKLERFPKMSLARMDDIAGCRLIFPSIKALREFRQQFHKARFNHTRKNKEERYDYIESPKDTGYRGVHDVYEYDVNSTSGKNLKGLFVEIQYRTYIQHAWATAVEVIGFITESQPKFEQGDKRYREIMVLASEILARAHENCRGPVPEIEDTVLVQRFLELDGELKLMRTLRGLNAANSSVSESKNSILIFSKNEQLEVKNFRDATEALRALFVLEREMPDKDIVLVRADTSEEVREAFKNYFSDAREFISLVETGCDKLSGKRILRARKARKKTSRRIASVSRK